MVHTSLKAAKLIEQERGVKVEVIDLRTISPLDMDTVIQSVQKTNRAIVVQEAQRTAGIAAEVMAQINEKAILHLGSTSAALCAAGYRNRFRTDRRSVGAERCAHS